jgi:hypothetical protein
VARSSTEKPPLSEASNKPKTDAMKNFEENLSLLVAFLNLLHPAEVQRGAASLGRIITRFMTEPTPKKLVPIVRVVNNLNKRISEYVMASRLSYEWISVMLVAFTEAYLEDGLIGLAVVNPQLLMNDAPSTDYARIFEVQSLDELREEMRRQWALQKLQGGPSKFVRRLKDMGARGYDDREIFRVQHLWDTRNLIVHSRGIVDRNYVAKFKHLEKGTHVKVNLPQIQHWLPALSGFVECTDAFFLSYRPSKGRVVVEPR